MVAAVAFGLAHAYQGGVGILTTGVLGGIMAALYLETGSLLLPVLLHAVIDLRFLLVPARVLPGRPRCPVTGPAAAVAGAADWPEIVALRTRVFVDEQGVPPEIEQDDRGRDGGARAQPRRRRAGGRHRPAAVWGTTAGEHRPDGDRPRGPRGAATAPRCSPCCRGRPPSAGCAEIELHAQVTARGFYERAGYTAVGEEYEEAGIAHVTMRRRLRPAGRRRRGRM